MKKKINLLTFKHRFEATPLLCLLIVIKNTSSPLKSYVCLHYLLKHSYMPIGFPASFFKNIVFFPILNNKVLVEQVATSKNIFALKIKNLFFIININTFYFILKFLEIKSLRLYLLPLNFFLISFLFLLNKVANSFIISIKN